MPDDEKNNQQDTKNKAALVGCTSANFHEAGRSEYLAHYVFSSFGTSVPVPRQEDTGLDLYCTLTERKGHRLWPTASFCVQVKSTTDPWEFASDRSVQSIVEHPLPIFLCVVNKKTATLSVFHTTPRFFVWTAVREPQRLVLLPGKSGKGYGMPWKETDSNDEKGETYSLSAPIAEFTLSQILEEEFHAKIKTILANWVSVDRANIFRIQAGVRQLQTISQYTTNDPNISGYTRTWRTDLSDEEYQRGLLPFIEHAKWLSEHLASKNDTRGHLRLDLLLRHLGVMDKITDGVYGHYLYSKLRQAFEPDEHVRKKEPFSGLDGLNKKIDELTAESIAEAKAAEKEDLAQLMKVNQAQATENAGPGGDSNAT